MRPETLAVHAGFVGDPTTHAVAVPIYQTVAYEFDSAEHGAALFNLEVEGHRYSRISNPTVSVLEQRVAALEGSVAAVATASGQAALHLAIVTLANIGSNVVSVPQLYGTTHTLFAHILPRFGITVKIAASDRAEDLAALIDAKTCCVFCESVGNPAGNVCDLEAVAALAHAAGVPVVVDNTVPTPILLRPIEFGADVVVHSLTKYLGGHGTTLGGAVVDGGSFDWAKFPMRFPMFCEPDQSYHGLVYATHFGAGAFAARCRSTFLRTLGPALSPLSAFLLLQGVETVALRVERHVANGKAVAAFLTADSRVDWVNYAGHASHPSHVLANKYLGGNACALMTFGVKGGLAGGTRFYDALKLVKRLVNIGDTRSLACHPASTTHRQMSPDEQLRAGVKPEAIRLSIGIEHISDIIADLDQALAAAVPAK